MDNKKISLCLAGGGIKGAAHIGVLKALEEENIEIEYIGGTSSGSIVSSLYAAGFSADEIYYIFKKYCKKIKYADLKNIFKLFFGITLTGSIIIDGLNSGKSIKKLIITIKLLNQFNMSYAFISKATNSYLIDNKIVLISLMNLKKRNYVFGNKIFVSGNQTMAYLARYYAKKNIKSFLGGALIPGTIGAGVYGNAGIKNINITKFDKCFTFIFL